MPALRRDCSGAQKAHIFQPSLAGRLDMFELRVRNGQVGRRD